MNEQSQEWAVRLRTAFQRAVSEDDMRQIAQNVVQQAKAGDPAAVKLLMGLLTPPQPQIGRVGPIHVTGNGRKPKVIEHREGE